MKFRLIGVEETLNIINHEINRTKASENLTITASQKLFLITHYLHKAFSLTL